MLYTVGMETLADIKLAMDERKTRSDAERLALYSGVRPDLKGFSALIDCVIAGSLGISPTTKIYEVVGAVRDIKPKTVMREIAYAVSQSFDIAARLSAMLGFPVDSAYINNSFVISYLGKIFENKGIECKCPRGSRA